MTLNRKFTTGATVTHTGIYQVSHSAHRLPKQVFLVQGGVFPRCGKCANAVSFELLIASDARIVRPVHVYELPVFDEEQPPESRKVVSMWRRLRREFD